MEAKHLQVISTFRTDLRKGLALLYECYGKSLFHYTVKNWHLDEDEGYEILYKTLETIGKVITRYEFTSEKHFTNWLFKIHKNNTLMFVRKKRSKDEIEFQTVDWQEEYAQVEEDNGAIDFSVLPIGNVNGADLYDDGPKVNPLFNAMEKALQTLNEHDRDILLLRMNNYSYEEIAAMLGIKNDQLKVRFLRAKGKVEKRTMDIIKESMQ